MKARKTGMVRNRISDRVLREYGVYRPCAKLCTNFRFFEVRRFGGSKPRVSRKGAKAAKFAAGLLVLREYGVYPPCAGLCTNFRFFEVRRFVGSKPRVSRLAAGLLAIVCADDVAQRRFDFGIRLVDPICFKAVIG